MLNQFRNFNPDSDVDELIALYAFGEQFRNACVEFGDVPEFVTVNLKSLAREIKARRAAELEGRLRKLKARKLATRTREQEQLDLDKEIAALEKLVSA